MHPAPVSCRNQAPRHRRRTRFHTASALPSIVAIVMVLPYAAIDRSTVHPPRWSWMVATLELELSRDTVPYNSVALFAIQ
jgi:hypothetical protein